MMRLVGLNWRGRGALLLAWLAPLSAIAQQANANAEMSASAGRPKWEAGVIVGGGSFTDYPGADQNHRRSLIAPFFIYRGSVLRVDREGIRGRLFNNNDLELDLTASAAFNARNNDAREGMPDLDYLFGIGPQIVYKGLRDQWGSPTVHLKARALMSTDFHRIKSRGFEIAPEVRWSLRPSADWPGALTFGVQPTWASRPLHQYFYQVEPSQATSVRPAYEARAGYLGTELNLTLSRRQSERLSWFATVRGMSLRGAANAASPLLRDTSNVSLGVGLVWAPWQSDARAQD